jgi:hypothetical protein
LALTSSEAAARQPLSPREPDGNGGEAAPVFGIEDHGSAGGFRIALLQQLDRMQIRRADEAKVGRAAAG